MDNEQINQARRFLAKALPWSESGETYACVQWFEKKEGRDHPIVAGRACRTLNDAVRALQWADGLDGTKDFYCCMSTTRQAMEKISKAGYKYLVPIRNQDNAEALKSLFIDVDVKPDKGYPTFDEAVEAFAKFVTDVGLPKPTLVVKSGGGLHCHWTLSRALKARDEWREIANALANAGKQHGLKADWGCTIDSVRILRIPGTLNHKTDPAKPVTLGVIKDFDIDPERMWKVLEPYKTALPALKPVFALEQPGQMSSKFAGMNGHELSEGLGRDPANLDALAKECPFIATAIATGGKDYSQPMWNLTTLIATFTDDPIRDAHRMGDQHPGYTKESTDAMLARKQKEKDERGLGFPSCKSISASGCKACDTCPRYADGKSPLAAGRKAVLAANGAPGASPGSGSNGVAVVAPAPVGMILPPNYMRDANTNLVCGIESHPSGQGVPVAVCDYDIYDPWLQTPEHFLNFTAKIGKGEHSIVIPTNTVNTMEMRRILQGQGLMLKAGEKPTQRMGNFLVGWITTLQQTRDSVHSAPFGWTVERGKVNGFVFHGTVYMKGSTRQAAQPDPVLQRQYHPEGDEQPWVDMAEFVTSQGRYDLDVIIATAFAAPLVRFTGHSGTLVSAYSTESGIGKTTALKIAQAVWGDPISGVQSLTDTQNAVMNKLGVLRSLPLYWDELKTEQDTKNFVNITFQTSLGKEKARMSRNIQQREPGRWQTLVVCCSNESLLNYVAAQNVTNDAGICRIFEFPVTMAKSPRDTSSVQIMLAKLHDNFGHAGLKYAEFLGTNYDTVEKEVGEVMSALEKETSAKQDERFWIVPIATVLLGAKYANKLGLTKFDIKGMQKFLIERLNAMRAMRHKQSVSMHKVENLTSLVQRFLSDKRARHTLLSNRICLTRGKPPKNVYKALAPTADPTRLDGLHVQIGKEDYTIQISSTRLHEWCREVKIPFVELVARLESEFNAQPVQRSLGAGVAGFRGFSERVIEIHCAGNPLLEDYIDDL